MSSGRVGQAFVLTCFFYSRLRPAQEIGGGFSHSRLRPAQESMG